MGATRVAALNLRLPTFSDPRSANFARCYTASHAHPPHRPSLALSSDPVSICPVPRSVRGGSSSRRCTLWPNGAFLVWQARSAAGHLYLRYLSLIRMGRRVWATLAWLASAPLLAAVAASGDGDTPENPVKAYFHDQRCVGDGCACDCHRPSLRLSPSRALEGVWPSGGVSRPSVAPRGRQLASSAAAIHRTTHLMSQSFVIPSWCDRS